MCVLLTLSAYGDEFAGGSGTPEDPYRIATASQLIAIGSDPFLLDRHYVLVADVNLAGHTFQHPVIAGEVIVRGRYQGPLFFTGSFHGAGHRIMNLTIEGMAGDSAAGLFGHLGPSAEVWGLGLENATVSGADSTGILAGRNEGRISSCYSTGSVTGNNEVGGLVGTHGNGMISNSYSTASVEGRNRVGGLVGYHYHYGFANRDPIWNCYATGPVTGDPDAEHVGGLVGYHDRVPDEDFGTASYFLRPEDGGGPNNGLGQPLTATALKQRGSFVGWDFVGDNEDGTDDVWFMPTASYPVLNWQANVRWVPDVNGLAFEEATTVLTNAGFVVAAESTEDYHRTIPVGKAITTDPYEYAPVGSTVGIIVSRGPYDWDDVPGEGTENNPYLIATAGVLEALSDNDLTCEACIRLTDDIDMSGRRYDEAVIRYSWRGTPAFEGTFDGDNHTIRHLNVSLFDTIDGEVRNLTIENADVRAGVGTLGRESHAGILAGENSGRVHNCHVTGRVSMSDPYAPGGYTVSSAGGLVGTNWGTITESQAAVEVTGQENVGGLVGDNLGTIADSHAEGSVTGPRYARYVGGLVGYNRCDDQGRRGQGNVLRCWATGDVTIGDDSRSVGGLVGDNTGLVSLSHASGTVRAGDNTGSYSQSSTSRAGGLVGFNAGDVTYCYATGAVSGYNNIGGLVGYNSEPIFAWGPQTATGLIGDCYATGKVTSWMRPGSVSPLFEPVGAGRLVGSNHGLLQNSYFLDPNDGSGSDNGYGTALSDAQMRLQANFAGWDFYGEEDGSQNHWFKPEGEYPVLSWQTAITGLARIPDVLHLPKEQAQAMLAGAGFSPSDTHQADCDRRTDGRVLNVGDVLWTIPGNYAPLGGSVTLMLNLGLYDWTLNTGDGSPENPYQIATAGELESLCDHAELYASYFVLTNDIDIGRRFYDMAVIAPATPFHGQFDGRGHCITNLSIAAGEIAEQFPAVGLFGTIDEDAEIRALAVHGARVQCAYNVFNTTSVGILAGTSAGTIQDCHVSGQIAGRELIGGLIGQTKGGRVTRCSATVNIDSSTQAGGLVGINGTDIEDSFAAADIRTYDLSGGLVGQNSGTVANCYSAGRIDGYQQVGGLVGTNWAMSVRPGGRGGSYPTQQAGYIENCYTTVSVLGRGFNGARSGGLVEESGAEDIVASYYGVPQENTPADNGLGEPLTQAQMQDRQSYLGWDFFGSDEDGTKDHWFMPDGEPPVLSWQTETSGLRIIPDLSGLTLDEARTQLERLGLILGDIVGYDYFSVPADQIGLVARQGYGEFVPLGGAIDVIMSLGAYDWRTMSLGTGSAVAPYEIAGASQLLALLSTFPDLLDKHFILTDDIDMAGRTYSGLATPLREFPYLSGTFDGQGHVIRNLTIDPEDHWGPLGLFGGIDSAGQVTNLGLDNIRINTGASDVGALAGHNNGSVMNCYSAGTISGDDTVGGLIGTNLGQMANCYSSGSVSGTLRVGGLLAINGAISGRGGTVTSGDVKNCYSTATVQGTSPIGGLISSNVSGDIIQSYYLSPPVVAEADNHVGEALTDDQMTDIASFLNWDFVGETANGTDDIWTLCEGLDSPRLSWENRPCPEE